MQKAEWSYAKSKREYQNNFKKIVENKRMEYLDSETCENCGSDLNMEYHHVIPLIFRGRNEITNIKRFCKNCHQKLHGIKTVLPLKATQNPYFAIPLDVLFPEFLHETCDNCNQDKGLSMRLVVPFEVGGQHVKGNFATLCSDCNHILDENVDENGILEHSHLIKKGQKQARLDGKHLGRPKVSKEINKVIVAFYTLNMDVKQLSKHFGMSITTIYRYKRRFDKKYSIKKTSNTTFTLTNKQTGVEKEMNLYKHAA